MEHPITPPPELVQRLCDAAFLRGADGVSRGEIEVSLILEAFAAGADQEFEACCAEVSWFTADILRAARRPKPQSEADQALADLDALVDDLSNHGMGFKTTNVRRALERLKELEALPND